MSTTDKNGTVSSKSSAKSAGPYTPAITPSNTGNESGGETNWNRSSATPYPRPKS